MLREWSIRGHLWKLVNSKNKLHHKIHLGHSLNISIILSLAKFPFLGHLLIFIGTALLHVISNAFFKFHLKRHSLNTVVLPSHGQKLPLIGYLLIFIWAALMQVISNAFFVKKFQKNFSCLGTRTMVTLSTLLHFPLSSRNTPLSLLTFGWSPFRSLYNNSVVLCKNYH